MLNIAVDELNILFNEMNDLASKIDFKKLIVDVESSGGCPEGTCYGGCAEGYN